MRFKETLEIPGKLLFKKLLNQKKKKIQFKKLKLYIQLIIQKLNFKYILEKLNGHEC